MALEGRGEMRSAPLVSVITTFLNADKFMQAAIESLLAQTYENWELLLVDDGSTDPSTETARQYAKRYAAKVRYFDHQGHENLGMSASRNVGIANAKGQYIAFLDADDVWFSHKLEAQVAILECHREAAMVYGPAQYWHGWTGRPQDIQRDFVQELGIQLNTLVRPPTLLTLFLQNEGATPVPSGILARTEVIRRLGGFEESFRGAMQLYDDQAFYAKICLETPVFVASGCWYRYRLHEDSCVYVVGKAGQRRSVRLSFLTWLADYLSGQGVKEGEVWVALQKELWRCRHPTLYHLSGGRTHLVGQLKRLLNLLVWRTLPEPAQRWLHRSTRWPPVGSVRLGSFRRLQPISRVFGSDRGLPIDRYYTGKFLSACASDIRGRTLEIGDDTYTSRFGGAHVTKSDVLHIVEGNPKATIVADLTCADQIPSDTFDCILCTQTLHVIYDMRAALKTLHRILKPGGVLLATLPGISQISRYDMNRWGDYWRVTTLSAQRLFEEVFPAANVEIEAHGNVLAAVAFLHGLAAAELRQEELNDHDPDYELLITARAEKPRATLRL